MSTSDQSPFKPPGAAPPPASGQPLDIPSNPDWPQSMLQQHPSQSPEDQPAVRLRSLMYNSSLAVCVACPLIALMPPRKMDLFTFGLGLAFVTSAGYAMEERTGKGLLWHVSARLPGVQKRQREAEARAAEEAAARDAKERQEVRRRWKAEEEKRVQERGLFKRLWMGAEGADWVEKRAEEEKTAAEEGKGFGSLIVKQVREVFGVKDEDEDEDDDDDDDDDD